MSMAFNKDFKGVTEINGTTNFLSGYIEIETLE
jgi:hypothetical protein